MVTGYVIEAFLKQLASTAHRTRASIRKSTETATIYRTCQTTKGKEMVASIRSQTEFEFSV
jgi:hypothetical protein